MTHKKVEKCLLVRHNQTLHSVTFRAITSHASKSYWFSAPLQRFAVKVTMSSESDLTPTQEGIIVGSRCGSLLYKFTKIIHTLLHILISYFSTSAFIPHQSMSNDMYRKLCAMVTERKKYDNVREKACNNLDQ